MRISEKINKESVLRESRDYGLVFLGALILAIGYSLFIIPHKLVPGGVFGLSIVAFEITGVSIGVMALAINIPLLLWGTKVLGGKAGLKTAFFMVSSSVLLDSITFFSKKSIIIDDILVSAIFGGLMVGSSVFMVKSAGATTGGNDIIARILSQKINLKFNQIILIIDAFIILLGVFVFSDFTLAAYCLITIVTTSKTLGHYIKKNDQNKTVLVFSKNNGEIQNVIEESGKLQDDIVKLIHHDSDHKMILVTKNNKKISVIEKLIYTIDPKAHIITLESNTGLV